MSGVLADWDRVALGASRGTSRGRLWQAVRTVHADGRSEKIEARALSGRDGDSPKGGGYVSANLYRLGSGARLLPCEMPEEHVLRFLADWRPADPAPPARPFDAPESPI